MKQLIQNRANSDECATHPVVLVLSKRAPGKILIDFRLQNTALCGVGFYFGGPNTFGPPKSMST